MFLLKKISSQTYTNRLRIFSFKAKMQVGLNFEGHALQIVQDHKRAGVKTHYHIFSGFTRKIIIHEVP